METVSNCYKNLGTKQEKDQEKIMMVLQNQFKLTKSNFQVNHKKVKNTKVIVVLIISVTGKAHHILKKKLKILKCFQLLKTKEFQNLKKQEQWQLVNKILLMKIKFLMKMMRKTETLILNLSKILPKNLQHQLKV